MNVHSVQTAALAASDGKFGFGWFMEQGLGKTYTDLLEFQRLIERGEATRHVVEAPNSFKGGWIDEVEKWGFEFDTQVWESGSNTNGMFLRKQYKRPPLVIVNYEATRSASTQDELSGWLSARPSLISADESIQLKGHDSSQTKAGIGLAKYARYSRILTGKPIVQGPHDLWGQMRFIKQLENKNYFAFKTAFCKMGGFKMKQVMGAQNEDYLATLIEPHVFRATKADWTDLPPKVHTIREYQLSAKMRSQFNSMMDDFVLWLESGEVVTVDAAITKYIKLAQIQSGFIIREDGKVEELVPPEENPRVALLREQIDLSPGKVTIPYRHRYVRTMLERQLADLKVAVIGGGMGEDEIRAQKHRFNNDPECRGILLQHTAAKYGHTILGGPEPQNRCSTNIFFENTYSGDDRAQIEDRNHRHGQTADMVVNMDLVGTPLDKAMIGAQQRKEGIFQAVFGNIRAIPKA